jgi:hypothetical protein
MIRRKMILILFLGYFLTTNLSPSFAQDLSKKLILLYTNNIRAEIDPCPV